MDRSLFSIYPPYVILIECYLFQKELGLVCIVELKLILCVHLHYKSLTYVFTKLFISFLPLFLLSSIIDSYLEPFTTYEYRVRGWNSFGRGSSDVTTVTTSEDKPWGVAPPRWSRLSERDDIIQLQWQAPARPNGTYTFVCMYSSLLFGCAKKISSPCL